MNVSRKQIIRCGRASCNYVLYNIHYSSSTCCVGFQFTCKNEIKYFCLIICSPLILLCFNRLLWWKYALFVNCNTWINVFVAHENNIISHSLCISTSHSDFIYHIVHRWHRKQGSTQVGSDNAHIRGSGLHTLPLLGKMILS